jgi:hypothetical protein
VCVVYISMSVFVCMCVCSVSLRVVCMCAMLCGVPVYRDPLLFVESQKSQLQTDIRQRGPKVNSFQ